MKIKRSKEAQGKNNVSDYLTKPAMNKSKRSAWIVGLIVVTLLMIVWVISIGKKAERTVSVVMLYDSVYKNQPLTEDDLIQYDMLQGEYEKYTIVDDSTGTKTRRLILWDERGGIIGAYAAYSLQSNKLLEYSDLSKSKVSNSDNVMYSYPGKELIKLDIGTEELSTFKTFLKTGDRLNIQAIYSKDEQVRTTDEFGNEVVNTEKIFKTETVFNSIQIADMLNADGDSILDLYENYKAMSIYEQEALDRNDAWKVTITPSSLILALSPEELEAYYYYQSKDNVTFKMSLPQRTD